LNQKSPVKKRTVMKIKLSFELRITLTYLLFGVCWIILTDILLEIFVNDLTRHSLFQSIKGIVFVVFSALIIYVLSRHYARHQQYIKKHLKDSKIKAEESDRLKSAFLANMSHEIRTPMNGILGFVKLLEESNLSEEQHAIYLSFVKQSSERLLETINDIIEISKIESNQAIYQPYVFDLNDSINYLFGFFTPGTEEKGLNFRLKNKLAGESIFLETDKNKLESVLTNFIRNAVKFTHEGEIEFGCYKEKDDIVFYVKDSGIGIPQNRHRAIFERFIQADLTITKPYEGSGLGLAIAKAHAGLLGGEIHLDSEEGKGSTFWFVLKSPKIVNSSVIPPE
jgi:signal transduction histidine kinase